MKSWKTLGGVLASVGLGTLWMVGCGTSRDPLPGVDAGCVGVCLDGGQNNNNNNGADGGIKEVTIAQAKAAKFCDDHLSVKGVVVTAIDDTHLGSGDDWLAQFWVQDPDEPTSGIYVDKFYTDEPGDYRPEIGDVLDIEGYLGQISRFNDRTAYRFALKSQFGCVGKSGKLVLTKTGTATPPDDNVAPAHFPSADGGRELAGTRVHFPGPLVMDNPNPPPFDRISSLNNDTVYFGFQVDGGAQAILVNNYKTFGTSPTDGGPPRCDFRAVANDGGSVVFPDGIRGVWDSYAHAPCEDGGVSSSCRRNEANVPGTTAKYIWVLYPQDCANDFAGAVVQ